MKRALRTLRTALVLLLVGPPLVLLVVWSTGALYYTFPVETLQAPAAVLFAAACLGSMTLSERRWRAVGWVLVANALVIGWFVSIRPANDREWPEELALMPSAEFAGDAVTVRGIRNFDYRSPEDFDVRYYDKTFDLSKLQAVDMLYSYWDDNEAVAHTMFSWDFGGTDVLSLSVEVRREVGEGWGGLPGLYKQFEILYVLADERDVVRLRTNYRGEQVYLIRTVLSPADGRRLLVRVLEFCNQLRDRPQFYRTVGNNCTTSVIGHVNAIWPERVPLMKQLVMNGYGPEVAYANRLHRTSRPFEAWKAEHHINGAARAADQDPEFSRRIRDHLEVD